MRIAMARACRRRQWAAPDLNWRNALRALRPSGRVSGS